MKKITFVLFVLFASNFGHSQDSLLSNSKNGLFLSLDGYRISNFGFRHRFSPTVSSDAYVAVDVFSETPQQPGFYTNYSRNTFLVGILTRFTTYEVYDASLYFALGPEFSYYSNADHPAVGNVPDAPGLTTTQLEYSLNAGIGIEYFFTKRLSLSGQVLAAASLTYNTKKWSDSNTKQTATDRQISIGRGNLIVSFYL